MLQMRALYMHFHRLSKRWTIFSAFGVSDFAHTIYSANIFPSLEYNTHFWVLFNTKQHTSDVSSFPDDNEDIKKEKKCKSFTFRFDRVLFSGRRFSTIWKANDDLITTFFLNNESHDCFQSAWIETEAHIFPRQWSRRTLYTDLTVRGRKWRIESEGQLRESRQRHFRFL